jgi:hypothetical protein
MKQLSVVRRPSFVLRSPSSVLRPPSSVLRPPSFFFRLALLFSWAIFASFVIRGAADVPFHPDESTHLFMSRDFDLLFLEHTPAALFWTPTHKLDAALRYHLLDAPLSRYLVGLSRALAGVSPVPLNADWNWSQTWEENIQAGNMPSSDLLFIARLPAALMTALAPLLIFRISRRLGGNGMGIVAALLYGFNSLVLLHGRRAMSEGPMLFTALLAFWWIVREPPRPVLTGLGAALSSAAKLTGLALLPVALFAGAFIPPADPTASARPDFQWGVRIRSLAWCVGIFIVVTLLLNPVLWGSPLSAFRAMGSARQKFHAEQVAALRVAAPNYLLDQPGLRLLAMLYQVYFAPLAFWDIPNYAQQTHPAELHYLSIPLHHLLRDPNSAVNNFVTGGLLLTLTLVGLVFGAITLLRRQASPSGRRSLLLFLVWTVSTIFILSLIDIPFQRYYLPLVPLISIWAAYGLHRLFQPVWIRIISTPEIKYSAVGKKLKK